VPLRTCLPRGDMTTEYCIYSHTRVWKNENEYKGNEVAFDTDSSTSTRIFCCVRPAYFQGFWLDLSRQSTFYRLVLSSIGIIETCSLSSTPTTLGPRLIFDSSKLRIMSNFHSCLLRPSILRQAHFSSHTSDIPQTHLSDHAFI